MKTVNIKAAEFFEMLRMNDTYMWQIFRQLQDGQPKLLRFLDPEEKVLFEYLLPATAEELAEDEKIFAKEYAEKISNFN